MSGTVLPYKRYMIIMKSKNEKRPYNWEFVSPVSVDPFLIKSTLETLCDIYVHKVQEITEWTLPSVVVPFVPLKNYTFSYQHKINGQYCRTTRQFLPRVEARFDKRSEIETQLQLIFGTDFKIISDIRDF